MTAKQQVTDSEILDYILDVSENNYTEIKTAIQKFHNVNLSVEALSDAADNFKSEYEIDGHVDACYVAYDEIMQRARSEISDVLDIDILDIGYEMMGGSICTTYNCCDKGSTELAVALKMATDEQVEKLTTNIFVREFFSDLDIDINQIRN